SAAGAYLEDAPSDPVPAFRVAFSRAWRLVAGNMLAYVRAMVAALLILMLVSIPFAFGAAFLTGFGPLLPSLIALLMMGVTLWVFCAELGRALLVTPVVVLEERKTFDALRRSRRLTTGFVSRVAFLVFISLVVSMAVVLGALAVGEVLLGNSILVNALSSVLLLPLYPAVACLVVVLYFDLRVRKEGLDLEILAGADPVTAA